MANAIEPMWKQSGGKRYMFVCVLGATWMCVNMFFTCVSLQHTCEYRHKLQTVKTQVYFLLAVIFTTFSVAWVTAIAACAINSKGVKGVEGSGVEENLQFITTYTALTKQEIDFKKLLRTQKVATLLKIGPLVQGTQVDSGGWGWMVLLCTGGEKKTAKVPSWIY